MPITPANFPALPEISNGEPAISTVFNRPLFALSTRTNSIRSLLEQVEDEVVVARGAYLTLNSRLNSMDSSISTVTDDRNLFVTGGSATWSLSTTSFTHGEIVLVQPQSTYNYIINAGSVSSIADGDALYVVLTRNPLSATLTFTKIASGSVPSSEDVLVIAVRRGNRLWVRGSGEFEDEETRELGDGLTAALLGRLGMADENDTDSHFTNTTIIQIADNIPVAISKHDLELEYNIRDRNSILHGGGNLSWEVTGPNGSFSFDAALVLTVPSYGDVTINSATVGTVLDGEVLYITFNRAGTNYTATLNKAASTALPLSNGNTNHYVLGYRKGTTLVLRTGEVFQDGEAKTLGSGGGGLVTYQNMSLFPSSHDDVTWNATTGELTCPGDLTLHFPWAAYNNTIQSTEFPIFLSTSGRKAYVVLDRSNPTNLTVVDDVTTIPITFSQPDVLLVAERVGDAAYLFGTQRYNDGDIKRIGEGFVAGEIFDTTYVVPSPMSIVTIPSGGSHGADDVTLMVWGNGNLLTPGVDYTEGPASNQISAAIGEMFPTGQFPANMRLRFRIDSIVTGGAGPGGGGGGGDLWSDPVYSDIVPDGNDLHSIGAATLAFKEVFLSDQTLAGVVYRLFVDSGSLQIVQV